MKRRVIASLVSGLSLLHAVSAFAAGDLVLNAQVETIQNTYFLASSGFQVTTSGGDPAGVCNGTPIVFTDDGTANDYGSQRVNTNRALSMLLTAKSTGQRVNIQSLTDDCTKGYWVTILP